MAFQAGVAPTHTIPNRGLGIAPITGSPSGNAEILFECVRDFTPGYCVLRTPMTSCRIRNRENNIS